MKNALILLFTALFTAPVIGFSQSRIIKGKVVAFNKFPIENITLTAKKSKAVVNTDMDGVFSIEVKKKDVIQIKNPLFMRHELKITASENTLQINLIFKESDQNVSKAIEEGYFKRDDLNYAMENLARENNVFGRFVSVYDAIKFAIPEASMVDGGGGSSAFVLRGSNSLTGNNHAIYLVNQNTTTDISFITPSEIRKIYKLSNSQAALYGSLAANGIICIELY